MFVTDKQQVVLDVEYETAYVALRFKNPRDASEFYGEANSGNQKKSGNIIQAMMTEEMEVI